MRKKRRGISNLVNKWIIQSINSIVGDENSETCEERLIHSRMLVHMLFALVIREQNV